jgi:hypothetical protein
MADIPKECDSCHALMRISDDTRTLDCPQCGSRFHLRPPCPYSPEVVEEAEKHIATLENATNRCSPDTRHAILWLLEEKWLASPGHTVTIKVGGARRSGAFACAMCKKELGDDIPVLHLEVQDRWRESCTILDLCHSHFEKHMLSGDMDVLRNQSLRLGLD